MSEANKDLVRRVEAAWRAGAVDDLDQHFAPGFVAHSNVPGLPAGLEGAKAAHATARSLLPDRESETLEMIAEGDRVFVRNRVTGTNPSGVPWIGAEPNGRPYDFESWSVYTIRGGKVVEHVGLNDVWMFAVQTGAVKPPVPA
ncbi:MAG: ester cyclase [Candidatus Dormibacterales bacterium]